MVTSAGRRPPSGLVGWPYPERMGRAATGENPDVDAGVLLARWCRAAYGRMGEERVSQHRVARDAGVAPRTFEQILAGDSWPEFRTLYRLSAALDIPLPGGEDPLPRLSSQR